ncbi:hypothetical protein PC110_g17447 [Phytophthora cactorum]|uniref:Retroviral polymerase SH3-like domain-containing protein n=1 Tax=Phytophthora cactorum TaxID=29920 RepID=A0A329RN54_9STRA|nr:hypothetical protein PC110_g17447 [Phytophthora cactorum]
MYQSEPMLDDLQTWGCLAHVRIRSESRQKKEKLEARTRLLLLLGYSKSTLGYQFIDLVTAPVVTARCGNLKFHEEFTTDGTYMTHLLENALFDGDHVPPETVPVARIKTSMETCLPARSDGIFRAEKPLEATCDFGFVIDVELQTDVEVSSYSDADYANDPVDRRSISGYITMLDGNVISYSSHKQEVYALKLSWKHPVPLLLRDNQGAIALTAKPGNHSKSKRIDNKYQMVRINVELKRLTTQHLCTDEMVDDTMTKALAVVKFTHFRKAMKVFRMQAMHLLL